MDDIAIIGAGYSGLTLALRLQQLGVPVTLYAAEEPDVMRRGRLVNTVGRFAPSVEREQVLGIDRGPAGSDDIPELQFRAVAPLDAGYTGRFSRPMRATDF